MDICQLQIPYVFNIRIPLPVSVFKSPALTKREFVSGKNKCFGCLYFKRQNIFFLEFNLDGKAEDKGT